MRAEEFTPHRVPGEKKETYLSSTLACPFPIHVTLESFLLWPQRGWMYVKCLAVPDTQKILNKDGGGTLLSSLMSEN